MAEATIKFLLAYALGNVMGGAVIGRLRGGIDLRLQGSGNIGASNALRTQGKAFALAVLLIDVLKGVIAARLLPALPWHPAAYAMPRETLGYICGTGVALGHCYPALLGFRGGKGVATLSGVFGALMPLVLPVMLLVFMLTILLSGYASAATLAAAFTALVYVLTIQQEDWHGAAALFTLTMTLLVIFKHRGNIRRLWLGKEHRFERARLLGRWIDQRFKRRLKRER